MKATKEKETALAVPKEILDGREALLAGPTPKITDDEIFALLAEESRRGTALARGFEDALKPAREKAHAAWKEILRVIRDYVDPINERVAAIDRALIQYRREQKAAAEAEQRRLAAEAQREQDAMFLAAASQLEAEGKREDADRILSAGAYAVAPAPPPQIAVPAVKGFSFRETFEFLVMDPALVPREFLKPDEIKIKKVVDTLGMEAKIPGVFVRPAGTIAKRRSF